MSEMTVPTTTSIEAAAARTVRPRLWRRLLHRPAAVVALVILLVIGALLGIGSARQKRTQSVPAAIFWLIGLGTVANVAIVVLWR